MIWSESIRLIFFNCLAAWQVGYHEVYQHKINMWFAFGFFLLLLSSDQLKMLIYAEMKMKSKQWSTFWIQDLLLVSAWRHTTECIPFASQNIPAGSFQHEKNRTSDWGLYEWIRTARTDWWHYPAFAGCAPCAQSIQSHHKWHVRCAKNIQRDPRTRLVNFFIFCTSPPLSAEFLVFSCFSSIAFCPW